jgi:hypothetical protein
METLTRDAAAVNAIASGSPHTKKIGPWLPALSSPVRRQQRPGLRVAAPGAEDCQSGSQHSNKNGPAWERGQVGWTTYDWYLPMYKAWYLFPSGPAKLRPGIIYLAGLKAC